MHMNSQSVSHIRNSYGTLNVLVIMISIWFRVKEKEPNPRCVKGIKVPCVSKLKRELQKAHTADAFSPIMPSGKLTFRKENYSIIQQHQMSLV